METVVMEIIGTVLCGLWLTFIMVRYYRTKK